MVHSSLRTRQEKATSSGSAVSFAICLLLLCNGQSFVDCCMCRHTVMKAVALLSLRTSTLGWLMRPKASKKD